MSMRLLRGLREKMEEQMQLLVPCCGFTLGYWGVGGAAPSGSGLLRPSVAQ